jgi:hypothetical protein
MEKPILHVIPVVKDTNGPLLYQAEVAGKLVHGQQDQNWALTSDFHSRRSACWETSMATERLI